MTDEEARDIKGRTIDELSEARQLLACLKAKAEHTQKALEAAMEALRIAARPERHAYPGRLPDAGDWPSWQALRDLTDDLAMTRTRIEELQSRLREWGAID